MPDIIISNEILVEVKAIFRELKCEHCGAVYGKTDNQRLDLGAVYLRTLSIIYCAKCAYRNRWAPSKSTPS